MLWSFLSCWKVQSVSCITSVKYSLYGIPCSDVKIVKAGFEIWNALPLDKIASFLWSSDDTGAIIDPSGQEELQGAWVRGIFICKLLSLGENVYAQTWDAWIRMMFKCFAYLCFQFLVFGTECPFFLNQIKHFILRALKRVGMDPLVQRTNNWTKKETDAY